MSTNNDTTTDDAQPDDRDDATAGTAPSLLADGGQSVSDIDRTCENCGDLIVVSSSDCDEFCVSCLFTSGKNYKNVALSMSASPGRPADARRDRHV